MFVYVFCVIYSVLCPCVYALVYYVSRLVGCGLSDEFCVLGLRGTNSEVYTHLDQQPSEHGPKSMNIWAWGVLGPF